MKDTPPRLYLCTHCRKQVVICSDCDRGNIYCFDGCAPLARKKSLQLAALRYQNSSQGKHRHAARQRQYRLRQKQKVTHQGSIKTTPTASLRQANKSPNADMIVGGLERCHCCGSGVSHFFRPDYLHQTTTKKKLSFGTLICGP